MPTEMPAQAVLKSLFDYDPTTGILTWRERPLEQFKNKGVFGMWNTRFAGEVVGSPNDKGYLQTTVNCKQVGVHRVIYKWLYSTDPVEIDHIDGNPSNNRANNLRSVTHKENNQNQSRRSTNTSGVQGVGWYKPTSKWMARIMVDGKSIHLGYFDKFEHGIAARQAAEIKYGFHINHGRI